MIGKWPRIKISDLCDLIVDCVNKTAPSVDITTEFKMIRTPNIKKGRINIENCRCVDKETFEKWTRRAKVEKGDVLLTREAPMGEVGMVNYDNPNTFLGQRIMQYRVNPKKLDPHYLLYSFLSPDLQYQFRRHDNSGSIVSHIRVPDCFEFEISTPPLKVQKATAKVLSDLDSKIELNNKINAELEAMAKLIYDYWFVQFDFPISTEQAVLMGKPDLEGKPYKSSGGKMVYNEQLKREIPEGWEVKELGAFGKTVTGKTPSSQYPHHFGNKIPFLTPVDFNQNLKIHHDADRYLSSEGKDAMKNYILPKGSVMITCIGSDMGKVAITSSPSVTNQQINSIIPKNEEFTEFLFQSIYLILPYLKKLAKSGSTVPIVNKSTLDSIHIPNPPNYLINKFSNRTNPINSLIENNIRQNQKLSELRDWLLPMLMNGQVTIKDAEQYVTEHAISMAAEGKEGYE